MLRRFWIYQRERFPLASHGLLVAVITLGGLGYSTVARVDVPALSLQTAVVAYLCALGYFFQLRVADEFKDYPEDARYRPYRPVPRGVISLRELAALAAAAAVLQLVLTLWLDAGLLFFLLAVWAYLGLMRVEFFVPTWLKARPIVYMLSHMVILPLIFLFVTACDWYVAGSSPPPGLPWLLAVGFFNGIVFEIGRKIRAPEAEEEGVETYSRLWGRRRATSAWLVALGLSAACAVSAAQYVEISRLALTALGLLGATAILVAFRYLRVPEVVHAKRIEHFSGFWVLAVYSIVGIIPLGLSYWF